MPRLLTHTGPLGRRVRTLARDCGGGINILFAFSLVPIVGIIGLGFDFGIGLGSKVRFDRAADAAALAGVVTAKAYFAANSRDTNVTDAALNAGRNQAARAFAVNAGKMPLTEVTLSPPQVTRNGQTINASVTYTATTQNTFGKIFKSSSMTYTNTVTASADLPSYLDFYLMVDVSGSMGLPSTPQGMIDLASKNVDLIGDYQQGCQFACHFPGNIGWDLAAGKIQLRSDSVNNAVCALLARAANPVVPNQYRIGLYPFVNQLATLSALADTTSSLGTLKRAADCDKTWPMAFTNLLDTGATQLHTGNDPSTGTGSGGTHFEVAMPQMKAAIRSFGDGSSSSNSKPFVFLITDGMQNSQNFFSMKNGKMVFPGDPSQFRGYDSAWWDGSKPAQIDPNTCRALKTAGAIVSILYIPYNKIDFVDRGGYVASENQAVNQFSPTLGTPLRDCASPGYLYTANTPADITAALSAMFDQALRVARLTQ